MSAVSMAPHGLKLLQLVGCKNRSELTLRVLLDGLELLTTLVASEAGVGAQGCHLLLLRGKNRLELCDLVFRQVEAFAKPLCCLMRIEVMTPALLLRWLLLCDRSIVCRLLSGLLAEGRRGGKSERQR
jgi:hypothetical protein